MPRVHIPAVWSLPHAACTSLARAYHSMPHFQNACFAVSKYPEIVVGGPEDEVVEMSRLKLCGCRAKTLNLLKPNAFPLFHSTPGLSRAVTGRVVLRTGNTFQRHAFGLYLHGLAYRA